MTATTLRTPKRVANGPEIRRRRYDLGYNIRQLAELAKIDRSHLSRIENGALPGSPAALKKIATALRVEVSEITTPGADQEAG
jgi:transcriptional regulator with XRE-family HTH domain